MAKFYGDSYVKEICSQITRLGQVHSAWRVFEDFVTMAAISLSNAVDWTHKQEREELYMEVVKRYNEKEIKLFPEMFNSLVEAMEMEQRPKDILGEIFHALELHNKYKGQFFSPQHLCDMMAEISIDGERVGEHLQSKHYITVCEPCCGSGTMVLGAAHVLDKRGFNHSENMVVTAMDIDIKCVYMCYIQLSLWGIPAVVIHGDTILCKEFSRWYTPLYMLGGWVWRERCGYTDAPKAEDEAMKRASDPVYAAIRDIEVSTPATSRSTEEVPKSSPPFDVTLKVTKSGQLSLF